LQHHVRPPNSLMARCAPGASVTNPKNSLEVTGVMHGHPHMNGAMRQRANTPRAGMGVTSEPTLSGQDAFGAIQEVVRILDADPNTDWSKVNISALREHLIDMNEVTLHAAAIERSLDNGIEIAVTGEGRP
jgi:hypothetical protein